MVIYSGFATRRHQQKYNQLLKQLLQLLSQIIITHLDPPKTLAFRHTFQKIQFEIASMDQFKYSDLKVSHQIEPLTQHIINPDLPPSFATEQLKRKTEHRVVIRTKRSLADGTTRSIESAKPRPSDDKRRSLSMSTGKNMGRKGGEDERFGEPTMEELMQMNPLIQRKMSNIRKKRYLKQRNSNNFGQIQEEDEEGEEKE